MRNVYRAPSVKAVLALVLLAGGGLSGCSKPKVGASCGGLYRSPEPFCHGNDLWVCSGLGTRTGEGVWIKTHCKGAKGCQQPRGDLVVCDISGNDAGDPCAYNHLPMNTFEACSATEANVMLSCGGDNALQKTACPGGCTPVSHYHVLCDRAPGHH